METRGLIGMKSVRWITVEPYGAAGAGAGACWFSASANGFDGHGMAQATTAAKLTASRPLGFGGSTG